MRAHSKYAGCVHLQMMHFTIILQYEAVNNVTMRKTFQVFLAKLAAFVVCLRKKHAHIAWLMLTVRSLHLGAGLKLSAMLLMQKRRRVGSGPSLNTCPR